MPSRVRIHFHEAGLDLYDTRAMLELWRLHKAAINNRYLLNLDPKVLPKVRWQLAIKLFEDAHRYMLDYTGNCWLRIVRERRGLKLQRPKKVKEKKTAPRRPAIRFAPLPLIPRAARNNAPAPMEVANAAEAADLFIAGQPQAEVQFLGDMGIRWQVGNAPAQAEPAQQVRVHNPFLPRGWEII